jgi:hypothetical protein
MEHREDAVGWIGDERGQQINVHVALVNLDSSVAQCFRNTTTRTHGDIALVGQATS